MTQREFSDWQIYWRTEPWGPWRDNVHAAILAREIRRPQLRRGARINLQDFMLVDPVTRGRDARAQVVSMLRMLGTKRTVKGKPKPKARPTGNG